MLELKERRLARQTERNAEVKSLERDIRDFAVQEKDDAEKFADEERRGKSLEQEGRALRDGLTDSRLRNAEALNEEVQPRGSSAIALF